MARQRYTVTTSWVLVGNGAAIFTVAKVGDGVLKFNETAVDNTAFIVSPKGAVSDQFIQDETKPTMVIATGDGWEIIGDGDIV